MTKEAEEQGEMEGSTGSDSKDKKDKEEEEREGDLHWGWTEKSISGRKTGMVEDVVLLQQRTIVRFFIKYQGLQESSLRRGARSIEELMLELNWEQSEDDDKSRAGAEANAS